MGQGASACARARPPGLFKSLKTGEAWVKVHVAMHMLLFNRQLYACRAVYLWEKVGVRGRAPLVTCLFTHSPGSRPSLAVTCS